MGKQIEPAPEYILKKFSLSILFEFVTILDWKFIQPNSCHHYFPWKCSKPIHEAKIPLDIDVSSISGKVLFDFLDGPAYGKPSVKICNKTMNKFRSPASEDH